MKKNGLAYFVYMPHRMEDLQGMYPVDAEKPYAIEKIIILPKIDYHNFIADLTVDRDYLEASKHHCYIDATGLWHCVLVQQQGKDHGVLVMTDGCDYPKWATYR